jgi:hypothetical protein
MHNLSLPSLLSKININSQQFYISSKKTAGLSNSSKPRFKHSTKSHPTSAKHHPSHSPITFIMDRIIPYKPAPQPPKPAPSSGSGAPAKPAPVDPSTSFLVQEFCNLLTLRRLWEISPSQYLKSAGTTDGVTADLGMGMERSLDIIDAFSQGLGLGMGWRLHIRFYFVSSSSSSTLSL